MIPTPGSNEKKARMARRRIFQGIGLVIALVIVLYAGWAVGVFAGGWRGQKTLTVSRYLPLPAAAVGWQPLSLHSYLWQRQTIEHYTNYLNTNSPGVFAAGQTPNSRQVAMTKIIRDWAAMKVADDQKIGVTPTDLDQAFNAQLLQGGDRAQTTKAINDLYGWTPEQFKQYVLKVAVIREKLREKLSFDDTINATERQQAERVDDLVKATPADFAGLAKQYSEDVYGASGGDLGFFGRGEHAKEIDEAVFSLDIGEISELVHTKFGWHILVVEEKKQVDGQDQVHARQIFIAAPSIDEYLTTQLNQWGVKIYLSEFSWDAKTGQVVVAG